MFPAVVIDGDHNKYTVSNELRLMHEIWEKDETENRIALLHDVGWPCGYRDFYYDPSTIPAEHVHDPDWENGVVWGDAGRLEPHGFRGMGKFAISRKWGPEHGVRSAVNEFLVDHPGAYDFHSIPSVFGLGVLVAGSTAGAVRDYVNELPLELMERLEDNRCQLYCEVLRQQYNRR